MGAAGDISITGAAVSAGDSVLLAAGNDLNMNAIQAGERRRYGGSGGMKLVPWPHGHCREQSDAFRRS